MCEAADKKRHGQRRRAAVWRETIEGPFVKVGRLRKRCEGAISLSAVIGPVTQRQAARVNLLDEGNT